MAITWTISTLERNTSDGGVVVAHWRASGSEVVGKGTYAVSSYGTCGFAPDPSSPDYVLYADITEEMAIGWVKESLGEEQVASIEASIKSQIDAEKSPNQKAGVPW